MKRTLSNELMRQNAAAIAEREEVSKRVYEFVEKYVSAQYGVIIAANGKVSPMYTSSVRAMAFIMQDGAGIGSGGTVYQLVPWSDTDVAREMSFDVDGIFTEVPTTN